MPLIKIQDMQNHARQNAYAIGAFELTDLNYLKPILDASERTHSPVILNLRQPAAAQAELEWMMPAVLSAARQAAVPVAVHFSHASSVDSALRAINLGCGGVMLDAALTPSGDHMAPVSALIESAHGCDTAVEGLLELSDFASPGQTFEYARRKEVDSLAIHIESEKDLDALADADPEIEVPLAVYLDTVPDAETHRRLTAMGVARICCVSALTDAANRHLGREAAASKALTLGLAVTAAQKAISNEVERLQTLWGSAGQAEPLLTGGRLCREVEHLIIYNVDPAVDEAVVSAMMTEGRKTLAAIPGVRRVFTGQSVRQDAAYRYCWLVRFSDETVIDSYRDHPDHVAFADTLFRPIAGDRISIDYEAVE